MEQSPDRSCSLWKESHARADRRPTLEPSVPEGLYAVVGTHAGAVCEELQPMGKTQVGAVHEGLYPKKETPRWSR